jgi:hypothetical protein
MNRIVLIDLSQRELNRRRELEQRASRLEAVENTKGTSGGLVEPQKEELRRLIELLDSDAPVDPLYQAVAAHVARRPWEELVLADDFVLKHGLFGSQRAAVIRELDRNEREIAAICGLLQIDSLIDPTQKDYVRRITAAQGEYRQNEALFDRAFDSFSQRFVVPLGSQIDAGLLSENIIGCIRPDNTVSSRKTNAALSTAASNTQPAPVPSRSDAIAAVSARDLAQVVRRLAGDGISATDKYLPNRMDSAFERATGVVEGAPPSAIEIDLPDLEEVVDDEIIKENLLAVQAIYFS